MIFAMFTIIAKVESLVNVMSWGVRTTCTFQKS